MSSKNKLELLEKLQSRVSRFHEESKDLCDTLQQIVENLGEGYILTSEECTEASNKITSVKALRKQCEASYREFGHDELPETFDDFHEEVCRIESMLDKTKYIEAKDFILRLNIHDKAIAATFEKLKKDLLAVDIESLSAEECEASLQKYVDLKNLLSCKPAEKAGYMLRIANEFDESILSLAFTGEYTVEDSPAAPDKEELSEEAEPESETEEAEQQEEDEQTEAVSDTEPEISLEERVDFPELLEDDPEDEAGVSPYADILAVTGYTPVETSDIKVEREFAEAQTKKSFSVKKFKEMIKSSPIGVDVIMTLRDLAFGGALRETPNEKLRACIDESRYSECIDLLFRKGYIQKATAEGYPTLYSVTEKGADLFSSRNACDYIKCTHNKRISIPVMNDDPKIYLNILMKNMSIEYISENSDVTGYIYGGGFVSSAACGDGKHRLFAGCLCDNAEDTESFLPLIESIATPPVVYDELHVFGLTKENAVDFSNVVLEMLEGLVISETTDIQLHVLGEDASPTDPKGPGKDEEPEKKEAPKVTDKPTKGKSTAKLKAVKAKAKAEAPEKVERPSAVKATPAKDYAAGSLEEGIGIAVDKFAADGKLHCAVAYAAAASVKYPYTESIYSKLAYAVNDPAAHCTYTSDNLFSAFTDFDRESEYYYQASSVLRLFFAGQSRYDYSLQQIHDSIKGNPALSDNQALNDLIYDLRTFRSKTGFPVDRYADYRSHDRVTLEKELTALKSEAASCYENDFERQKRARSKIINRRYEATWRNIFSKEGDFGVYVKAASVDDTGYVGLAKDFMESSFIKDEMSVSADNIDPRKVEDFIDREWDKALEQVALRMKSSDLMGSLRSNLRSHIYKSLTAVCNWIEIHEALGDDKDKGHEAYAAVRDRLISLADAAAEASKAQLETTDVSTKAGLVVLIRTIREIRSKLDGLFDPAVQKYFYADFLKKNYVILGEDYFPDMECAVTGVDGMDMMALIEKHAADENGTMEENLDDYCDDNYGSACLIADYIRKSGKKDPEILSTMAEAQKYAAGQLEFIQRDFVSDIELAQSYGQLDTDDTEDKKDRILRLADKWYNWAEETWNYGFYKSLLEELRAQIKHDAGSRGASILRELSDLLKHDHTLERDHSDYICKINQMILERQNYLVAEDMINNLLSGDIPADTELFEEDYLADFQSKYSYYYKMSGTSGQALSSRVKTNDLKGLSTKDMKGALALKSSWPNPGRAVTPESLKVMLTALGMDIERITPADTAGNTFNIRLKKPLHEDEKTYGHPIYAFGSMGAREGFRFIWLSGAHNADALIAKMNEYGKGRHTIAFLDHPLTETERRRLARKIKEEGSSRVFAVIDRVLYMYLIHNYSETYIGRMLMETVMPFAYFQPYIYESSKVMAPEMFIGRKDELEKIKDPAGVNIVYGGRQLGKSALLRKAKTDINGESEKNKAVLIDIKDLDYKDTARKVAQTLYDEKVLEAPVSDETNWDAITRAVRNTLNGSKKIGYLLLMLDEADRFLESCEEVGYSPFNALKDIQMNVDAGRFKFVVAGLRNVIRFNKAASSGNSVLPHLESLTVKPFSAQEARMLLEQPLFYLGFRFPEDDSDLVPMILATANRFPGLVQLYCAKLIEALKKNNGDYDEAATPPYVIEEKLIKRVLAESDFRNQIREKFMITLTIGDDDYYYILALILAYLYRNYDREGGYSAADILRIAKELNTKRISGMTKEQVDALMTELCELNVIRVTAENRYLFSRYNFFTMMGTSDEVDEKLLSFSE